MPWLNRRVNGLASLGLRIGDDLQGSSFGFRFIPNEDSVLRLTSAVLAEIHEEWLTGRQYLNLADWSTMEKPASQSNYRKSVAQSSFSAS